MGYRGKVEEQAMARDLRAQGHTLLACVDQHHVPRRIPAEAEAVLLGPEVASRPRFEVEAERAAVSG